MLHIIHNASELVHSDLGRMPSCVEYNRAIERLIMYYNKKGESISLLRWASLLEDMQYKVVKQETLPNGNFVSTVWTGTGINDIFETMVFESKGNYEGIDEERYSTEEEAIKGHDAMVARYTV